MLFYGLWASRHLPYLADIGKVLAHRGVGSYTLSMSGLFDLTTEAFAALRTPALLAAEASPLHAKYHDTKDSESASEKLQAY